MENTNELKYTMDMMNFYRNIMISPKCIELVDMLEAYSELYNSMDYSDIRLSETDELKANEIYDIECNMVDFILNNINLQYYGLGHYDDGEDAIHSLVFMLCSMYEDDI